MKQSWPQEEGLHRCVCVCEPLGADTDCAKQRVLGRVYRELGRPAPELHSYNQHKTRTVVSTRAQHAGKAGPPCTVHAPPARDREHSQVHEPGAPQPSAGEGVQWLGIPPGAGARLEHGTSSSDVSLKTE